MSSSKKWFPLESNDAVMTEYIKGMGIDTTKIQYTEVLSLEDWALGMVPRPCYAVLMVYPIKSTSEDYAAQEATKIEKDGQVVSPELTYMKQITGNACGTIGILHSLTNTPKEVLNITPDSYIDKFMGNIKGMSPMDIATYLDKDEELETTHEQHASGGQSSMPEDINVNTHFVCFTYKDGCLYELDGRKAGPINHGECTQDTLLEDACRVIQGFMDRDPGEVNFSICALTVPGTD
jgi:ubiquitin carboxyl-terminal hydrolase L3